MSIFLDQGLKTQTPTQSGSSPSRLSELGTQLGQSQNFYFFFPLLRSGSFSTFVWMRVCVGDSEEEEKEEADAAAVATEKG